MRENKIFIDNFYEQRQTFDLEKLNPDKELHKIITGFHSDFNPKEVRKKLISEILKSLMLHDKVVLATSDTLKLINAFGYKDFISLVQTSKFEFVDDEGLSIGLGEKDSNHYSLSDLRFASDAGKKNSIQWLEEKLIDSKKHNNNDLNVSLLNIEKYNKVIDAEFISDQIHKETQYDLANLNVTNNLNLISKTTEDVKKIDIYNILRLSRLNKTLIYSSLLGIDNMAIDGAIKPILAYKLSPSISATTSVNLFDAFFQDIFKKKSIPDLADLYLKNIISINDYIDIITSASSWKFRNWITDKDYDPVELEKDLINSSPNISNKYSKFIRWSIPNAIGLFSPTTGLITSFADGYIYEKLTKGWHPNFFLDDLLRQRIDDKIRVYTNNERTSEIKRLFPNVGRNDLCPCGSRKKFKNCCGK